MGGMPSSLERITKMYSVARTFASLEEQESMAPTGYIPPRVMSRLPAQSASSASNSGNATADQWRNYNTASGSAARLPQSYGQRSSSRGAGKGGKGSSQFGNAWGSHEWWQGGK